MRIPGLLLLAAFCLSAFAADEFPKWQPYLTKPFGNLSAPRSSLATPDGDARARLYLEARMETGPYRGESLNTSERSSPVILRGRLQPAEFRGKDYKFADFDSDILADYPLRSDEVLVARFKHLQKFYVAVIPLVAPTSVELGYVKFMPIASHFLMFLNLPKPIRLVAEVPTRQERLAGKEITMLDQPILLDTLVDSVEGTSAMGRGDFDLWKGITNQMVNSFQLGSVDTQLLEILQYGMPRKRYLGNFTAAERLRILHEVLYTGDRMGNQIYYNLLLSNCVKLGTDQFDRAVGFLGRSPGLEGMIADYSRLILNTALPLGKVYPLVNEYTGALIRGYVLPGSQLSNLEDAPEHQARIEELKKLYPKLVKYSGARCQKVIEANSIVPDDIQ